MIECIHWSIQAENSYGHIIDYMTDEFGATRTHRYIEKVHKEIDKLLKHPQLGPIEPWLEGSRYEFRQLVIEHLTKIIYRVTDNSIEIADVWDVRKNPKELVAHFKE